MKEKTLVILAAGMGSRFGGLKQIEPVGPNKEILADYSIYDAIEAGFTKVVFVIREEHIDYFKENITKKYQDKIEVLFVSQELHKIPSDVTIPSLRTKMWGTTHALLCAKDLVKEGFVMINGDDFYGRSSYQKAAQFLDAVSDPYEYMLVGYPFCLANSKNGKVNRAVIKSSNGYVTGLDECSVEEKDGEILATTHATNETFIIDKFDPVSMNFFVFQPSVFSLLEEDFDAFIHGKIEEKNECLIPNTIKKYIVNDRVKMKVEVADAKWLGVTYKEDLDEVKMHLQKFTNEGIYPKDLWE